MGAESPKDECGLFGVWAPGEDVARLTYFGLFAQQHRGQESAGIAVSDGHNILIYKDLGLVAQVFNEATLTTLQGDLAVGHTRYSTTGSTTWDNAQPVFKNDGVRALALGHNGNLVNTGELVSRLGSLLRRHDRLRPGGHDARERDGPSRPRGGRDAGAARARGCLLLRDGRRALGLRRPGPPRSPAARRREASQGVRGRLGDLRTRHRRRHVHPRGRARRADPDRRSRAPFLALRPEPARRALHLRVRLPVPGRLADEGGLGARGQAGDGQDPRRRAPGRRRSRDRRAEHRPFGRPGVLGGLRDPLRRRAPQEPVRRPDVHPAVAVAPRARREAEAEPAAGHDQGQAADRGGRLDRAGHHHEADRRDAPRGRRRRGPHPDHVPADPLAMLLRDRHEHARGARRGRSGRRRDPCVRRRRFPRLPLARGVGPGDGGAGPGLLPRVLRRRVPDPGPGARRQVRAGGSAPATDAREPRLPRRRGRHRGRRPKRSR